MTASAHDSPVRQAALEAREASRTLATLSTDAKNALLLDLARAVRSNQAPILEANRADVASASNLTEAKLKRLRLTEASLAQLAAGLEQIAALPDPVGEVTDERTVPSGLRVVRARIPLGVIAMIYEARPGVTLDAFALAFKSGNAVLLKGGRESARANAAMASLARGLLRDHRLPERALTDLSHLSREDVRELLTLSDLIDLVIPRGGEELIRAVVEHSRIPTIQHFKGVCHAYVHAPADEAQAVNICVTAKAGAPATCNALECVLVDARLAPSFVPALVRAMQGAGVEVRAEARAAALARGAGLAVVDAAPDDFGREFLDTIVALKVVDGLDEAIAHVHRFGSNHTEAILTRDEAAAEQFVRRVHASCVVVNASTRFNDGFQLGLGAEIGISTSRLHAYGPMGLEELTTRRFIVRGAGQTR